MKHAPHLEPVALAHPPPEPHAAVTAACAACRFRHSALCTAIAHAGALHANPVHPRHVARDRMLFAQGEAPSVMGILKSGLLRRERILADGRRSLLGLVTPGEIVGTTLAGRAAYSLEAATDAVICVFDQGLTRTLLDGDPDLRRTLLEAAAAQHDRQLEMNWQRGALTSRERIMAFLVSAAATMPVEPLPDGSLVVTVELPRRDWADLSNTTVETISRTLRQLAEKRMVRTVAPGRYWIRDLALLADLAGLDPAPEPRPAEAARHPAEAPASDAVDGRQCGHGGPK